MPSFKFSLWWISISLKLEYYCQYLCKKKFRQVDSWVFTEQIHFRSVFKPSQTSKMEVIAKILDVSKSFDYFFEKLHLRCLDEFCSFLLFYTIAVKTAIYCPEFNLEKKCNKPLIKGVTHFSIYLFIVNTNKTRMLREEIIYV